MYKYYTYDLYMYFLWDWIGRFSRGSNRIPVCMNVCHVCATLCTVSPSSLIDRVSRLLYSCTIYMYTYECGTCTYMYMQVQQIHAPFHVHIDTQFSTPSLAPHHFKSFVVPGEWVVHCHFHPTPPPNQQGSQSDVVDAATGFLPIKNLFNVLQMKSPLCTCIICKIFVA